METMQEFWSKCHNEKDIRYLTGSEFSAIRGYMHYPESLKGMTVLNIGVGTGLCTEEIGREAKAVYALDICQPAIDKVKHIINCGYINAGGLPGNAFDLITCHLVTQHNGPEELRVLFKECFRALKPGAQFIFQIASPRDGAPKVFEEPVLTDRRRGGGCVYTLGEIGELVKPLGYIRNVYFIENYPEYDMAWYSIHAGKLSDITEAK